MLMRNKKGAVELSIGTIVIVVLAMSMLILGLILVKSIFETTTGSVDIIDQKLKNEINKLFVEDKRTVVYLPNQKADIKQGEDWGVAFAIKNLARGTAGSARFGYEIIVSDPDATTKCGIGEREIEEWITTGRVDSMDVVPGENYYGITRFMIPEGSPLCTVRFHLRVTKDGEHYATDFFDVEVLSK